MTACGGREPIVIEAAPPNLELEAFEEGLKAAQALKPKLPSYCRTRIPTIKETAVEGEDLRVTLARAENLIIAPANDRLVNCIVWYNNTNKIDNESGWYEQ